MAIDADHVVVDQHVGDTELLDALRVGADRARVVADLVMGDDCTDLHVPWLPGATGLTRSRSYHHRRRHRRHRR